MYSKDLLPPSPVNAISLAQEANEEGCTAAHIIQRNLYDVSIVGEFFINVAIEINGGESGPALAAQVIDLGKHVLLQEDTLSLEIRRGAHHERGNSS